MVIASSSVTVFQLVGLPEGAAVPLAVGAVKAVAFAVVVATTPIAAPWRAPPAHRLDPKLFKQVIRVLLVLMAVNVVVVNMVRQALGG